MSPDAKGCWPAGGSSNDALRSDACQATVDVLTMLRHLAIELQRTDDLSGRESACATIGYPKAIRVDRGFEFVLRELDLWAYTKGVTLDSSRPGKPTSNAFIEAFNGWLRAECLHAHWFLSLADAAEKPEAWDRYYNEVRPHSAIGNEAARHRFKGKPNAPISLMKPGDEPSTSPGKRPANSNLGWPD